MRYTKSQLDIILQFIKEDDIDEIETMAFGTYTTLNNDSVSRLMNAYKVVWLHDDPYYIHLIRKELLI